MNNFPNENARIHILDKKGYNDKLPRCLCGSICDKNTLNYFYRKVYEYSRPVGFTLCISCINCGQMVFNEFIDQDAPPKKKQYIKQIINLLTELKTEN
jgi:hypothetical protein